MPPIGPIKRRNLIKYLKKLGFDGPYSGGKHQFMIWEDLRLFIPNPHDEIISVGLLLKILKQAGISRETWEAL